MKLFLLLISLFSVTQTALAKDYFFKPDSTFILFAPPVINKDYFGLDAGFVVNKRMKKHKLDYHLYVTGTLFQDSSKELEGNLKAAALGFKFGGLAAFFPQLPLFFKLGTGYAKTALHHSPIFGNENKSVSKKDMFLIETGLAYKIDHFVIELNYQRSNLKYFPRHFYIQLGVNY